MSALPADPAPRRSLPILRMPLRATMARVAERGLWQDALPVLQAHGLESVEWLAFVGAALGIQRCAACGRRFVATSRRIRYCCIACSKHGDHTARRGYRLAPCPECGRMHAAHRARCRECYLHALRAAYRAVRA